MSGGALKSRRADEFLVQADDPSTAVRVITNPDHPEYDPRVEREVDSDIKASIRIYGQLQAAIGSKTGEVDEKGRDVVVLTDGRGRWAAIQELWNDLAEEGVDRASWPVFRLSVRRRTSEARNIEEAIVANAHRDGLTQLEIARKAAAHLARCGEDAVTLERVRMLFRFPSIPALRNCLALLDCDPVTQQAVAEGSVSPTLGMHLSKESPEVQREVTRQAEQAASEGKTISVREGKEKIRDITGKRPGVSPMVPRQQLDRMIEKTEGWIDAATSRLAELDKHDSPAAPEASRRLKEELGERIGFLRALRWVAGAWQVEGSDA